MDQIWILRIDYVALDRLDDVYGSLNERAVAHRGIVW